MHSIDIIENHNWMGSGVWHLPAPWSPSTPSRCTRSLRAPQNQPHSGDAPAHDRRQGRLAGHRAALAADRLSIGVPPIRRHPAPVRGIL